MVFFAYSETCKQRGTHISSAPETITDLPDIIYQNPSCAATDTEFNPTGNLSAQMRTVELGVLNNIVHGTYGSVGLQPL
jgi:hypothetical protein